MFLSAILEMCLSIISILKTFIRRLSHTYILSLFYSVNKPTLQLSAPDCPLWYAIYLFSGVVTPLLSLFSKSLCHIKPFIPTDGHIPSSKSWLSSGHLWHLDNKVKCFRFMLPLLRPLIQYSHQNEGR